MENALNPAILTPVSCKHCQSPISSERRGDFCCSGCETVYGILMSAGLSDYCDLQKDGICFRPARPAQSLHGRFEFKTETLQNICDDMIKNPSMVVQPRLDALQKTVWKKAGTNWTSC